VAEKLYRKSLLRWAACLQLITVACCPQPPPAPPTRAAAAPPVGDHAGASAGPGRPRKELDPAACVDGACLVVDAKSCDGSMANEH
jgi:hypothetical protein